VFGPIPSRVEKPTTVIVTEPVRRPNLRESLDYRKHFPNHLVQGRRDLHSVTGGEQARVKEKIECVNMVVQRLFEVDSIPANLTLSFLLNDPPSFFLPSVSRRQLRTKSADEEERNGLTQ
jgi:hypothetical protein